MNTALAEPEESLRERKKRRTRLHIVDTAAALFHERGFDDVTVADVARAAEVGEQTVYNYFSTKEGLVFDEADAFSALLTTMIRDRKDAETLVAAVRRQAHAFLDGMVGRPANPHRRGGMPYLIVTSPTVRRGWLSLVERFSRIAANALVERTGGRLPEATSGILGWSIVSIFTVIIEAVGVSVRDEDNVDDLIVRLRPQIDQAIDVLEHGLATLDLSQ
jgi:AcrR family transcriptional regulator